MPDNRCKGMTILNALRILRQEGGAESEAACIARLSEELGGAVRYGAIVRGGWYPLGWQRELMAVAQAVGMGANFPRTVGRIAVQNDLAGGVYAVFMKVASPAFVIAGAARLFSRYYEVGTMNVLESRAGFVRVKFDDCAGFDGNIWHGVLGGSEGALQAAGASDVRVRLLEGGRDGDDRALFEAHYHE